MDPRHRAPTGARRRFRAAAQHGSYRHSVGHQPLGAPQPELEKRQDAGDTERAHAGQRDCDRQVIGADGIERVMCGGIQYPLLRWSDVRRIVGGHEDCDGLVGEVATPAVWLIVGRRLAAGPAEGHPQRVPCAAGFRSEILNDQRRCLDSLDRWSSRDEGSQNEKGEPS